MKFKIFIILWATFVLTLIGSSFIYSSFLNNERMNLIDSQIESYASILAHSDLITRDFAELDEAEQQVQEKLGGNHIGLVLILRNFRGKIIYKNNNAESLELNPNMSLEWQFLENEDNILRLYTKKLPDVGRILQIGTVVNQQNFNKLYYSRNQVFYFILLIMVSAILSWWLSTKLFVPMKNLARDLNVITKQLDPKNFNSATWDTSFYKSKDSFLYKNDEFAKLIESVRNLLTQIRLAFQMNKNHSARLAHEVNTPLSLIKNRLKELETSKDFQVLSKMHQDVDRLADFVHRYLEFSESLNIPQSKTDIYAIKLNTFAEHLDQTLKPLSQGRIQIESNTNHTVFANHHDLEHVIQNLVTNALKYSPQDRNVLLNFVGDKLIIKDFGDGIPAAVLDKLGSPFNIGANQKGVKGTGLGLAWILSISKKYDWKLDFKTSGGATDAGTEVTIQFS